MKVIFLKENNFSFCISQNSYLLDVTKTASRRVLMNKLFCDPLVSILDTLLDHLMFMTVLTRAATGAYHETLE
jgi:hypothetical protein